MTEQKALPEDFIWGASAAAYQIEGGSTADGKGRSVWDMFCESPGKIWHNHTGAEACEHYARYAEDVGLMRELGLRAYRFSVSWPRVLPEGVGTRNAAGLGFYERLVDQLLAAGITPFCTLFHWDFPCELFYKGGWLNRDSANWFADYATTMAERLGDRVKYWFTFNEPQVFIFLGHQTGEHAPGLRLPFPEVLRASHNTLLAHGQAVRALKAINSSFKVGISNAIAVKIPQTANERDVAAARRATLAAREATAWTNTRWMDPIFLKRYPEDSLSAFGAPGVQAGDLEIISAPLELLGLNVYNAWPVSAGPDGAPVDKPFHRNHPHTAMDWPIVPEVMYYATKWFGDRYRVPLMITENGRTCRDIVSLDGKVHDPNRIDFIHRHLLELHRAIGEGADVRGYFHWSIMDNFEWAQGYKERFGLIYVDYETQQRIPKDSAYWYRDVVRSNGKSLFDVGR